MSDEPTAGVPAGDQDSDEQHFVNAVVTVPAEKLASFYQAVADWWEREGRQGRGRIIR